jgi:hypothetical protein
MRACRPASERNASDCVSRAALSCLTSALQLSQRPPRLLVSALQIRQRWSATGIPHLALLTVEHMNVMVTPAAHQLATRLAAHALSHHDATILAPYVRHPCLAHPHALVFYLTMAVAKVLTSAARLAALDALAGFEPALLNDFLHRPITPLFRCCRGGFAVAGAWLRGPHT